MVTLAPVPSAFTVMVGAALASVMVLLATTQLAALLVLVSPKTRLPTVRAVSFVTVVSAVRSTELKSTVTLAPEPTALFSQFPAVDHVPPSTLVQIGDAVMSAVTAFAEVRL